MAPEQTISTDVTVIEGGKIIFSPDVIATIANLAASEVEGVENLSGTVAESISGMLGGKKSLTKGIKVDMSGEAAVIDISVVVKYGYKIHEVCRNIQTKVKSTIETMTGIRVSSVNIAVQSISFEKPAKAMPEAAVSEENTEA